MFDAVWCPLPTWVKVLLVIAVSVEMVIHYCQPIFDDFLVVFYSTNQLVDNQRRVGPTGQYPPRPPLYGNNEPMNSRTISKGIPVYPIV